MIKKLLLLTLITSVGLLGGCVKKETTIKDDNLKANMIDDNYRTYYEIFVGGFSDSNKDGIGDIQGLINRLDYLNDGDPNSGKSLGVTGIWLMPIMPSNSYHKYDVRDYKNIDSNYGTLEDFQTFLEETEKRGINVIIDLVMNHTSKDHPWFKAFTQAVIEGDTSNKYYDYYSLYTEETKTMGKTYYPINNEYFYEGNFSSSMPELNFDNEDVKAEFIDIMQFWVDLGVDGFRLDAAKYVFLNERERNITFWNWFMDEAKKIKEDIYVVGEVWSANTELIPYYEPFSNFDFEMSGQEGWIASTAIGYETVNRYVEYLNNYRNSVQTVNDKAILTPFISNHDQNRSSGYLAGGKSYSAANLYLLSYGTPFIYYGEEIGMKGARGSENTDANRRLAMLWGDKDTVEDPIGTTYDPKLQTNGTVKSQISDSTSLYNHYKKLIMIRNAYPEVSRGTYEPLYFEGHQTFGGFKTTYKDSTIGIFHNTMDTTIEIDFSQYDLEFEKLLVYVGMEKASLNGNILTIGAYTSVLLQ